VDQATGVRLNKPHKAADPRQGSQIRDRRGAAIAARKRLISEWTRPTGRGAVPTEILSTLGAVPLAEIIAAAGCSKASASDYQRGKRTAARLGQLSRFPDSDPPSDRSPTAVETSTAYSFIGQSA